MSWTGEVPALAGLEKSALHRLDQFQPMDISEGTVLFSPGDAVRGYVILLSGRVGVHLLGPTGRDIRLYDVEPGQSCIQSTLGLLGGEAYSGEAVADCASRLVLLPRTDFLSLLDISHAFRNLVFTAFAGRMQKMMHLIENVSFLRVEVRLAALIAERADGAGILTMTQAEMASAIGTAREVISRRLDKMARAGLIEQERGQLRILDRPGLDHLIRSPAV